MCSNRPGFSPWWPVIIAMTVCGLCFLVEGRYGLYMSDEGYLWYGVQRVMQGEIPIRDFMAYDPGRYYWSAAVMSLMNSDGIIALRLSALGIEILGFAAILIQLDKCAKGRNVGFLILAALSLALWAYPRHKYYDVAICLVLLASLTSAAETRSLRSFFVYGLCTGVAAFFGRNHGVYGVIGGILCMLYLAWSSRQIAGSLRLLMAFCAGVVLGYAPLLAMFAVPGFLAAFWRDVVFTLTAPTTNLPVPVPWPWRIALAGPHGYGTLQQLLAGVFFVLLLVFPAAGLLLSLVKRRAASSVAKSIAAASATEKAPVEGWPPLVLACLCLALPYAHFAFSRADMGHLPQGIFPFAVGLLGLCGGLAPRARVLWAGLFLVISILTMGPVHPRWQCASGACVETAVGGDALVIDQGLAQDLATINSLVAEYSCAGCPVVFTPYWATPYAILRLKSPLWAIFALSPYRYEPPEELELDRIRTVSPRLIIVADVALDGREELRYRNTHPLIYRYLETHYRRLPNVFASPDLQVFVP
jgi:hypothetical protein